MRIHKHRQGVDRYFAVLERRSDDFDPRRYRRQTREELPSRDSAPP